jgi:hypothetical protein
MACPTASGLWCPAFNGASIDRGFFYKNMKYMLYLPISSQDSCSAGCLVHILLWQPIA